MSKNGTLTARQRRAVAALVCEPTVARASGASGVSRATLYRWLNEPCFEAALTRAQGDALRESVARLSGLMLASLGELARALQSPNAALRLRAADIALRHVLGLLEYAEVERRLRALEERAEADGEKR